MLLSVFPRNPQGANLVEGISQNFTSSQVSQYTGLTPRQLQWWDEQGIVVPAREGHRRVYSAKDVAELSVLCDLRRRGFSLQRIRRMIAILRRDFGHRLADLAAHNGQLHLLTDGESIFLCDSEHGVIDLLRNAQQPLLALCLGPVMEHVSSPAKLPVQVPKKRSPQPARAAKAAHATART
jgi:DNA-binding transcriptional MerR regulator